MAGDEGDEGRVGKNGPSGLPGMYCNCVGNFDEKYILLNISLG